MTHALRPTTRVHIELSSKPVAEKEKSAHIIVLTISFPVEALIRAMTDVQSDAELRSILTSAFSESVGTLITQCREEL